MYMCYTLFLSMQQCRLTGYTLGGRRVGFLLNHRLGIPVARVFKYGRVKEKLPECAVIRRLLPLLWSVRTNPYTATAFISELSDSN